jgi:hypothetical protein
VPTEEEAQAFDNTGGGGDVGSGESVGPASGQADCSNFHPTSPIGTMANNSTSFFWDAATGATSYVVTLINAETGTSVASFATGGPETSVGGNVSSQAIGGGSVYQWYVDALVDGQLACRSATVQVIRDEFDSTITQQEPQQEPQQPIATEETPSCIVGPYCNCNSMCEGGPPLYENGGTCPADCPP